MIKHKDDESRTLLNNQTIYNNLVDPDSDNDGLSDGYEVDYWGNDWSANPDGDSYNNIHDFDSDGGGQILTDRIESKQMDKHYIIYADNIKKIKYKRDVGGIGSRVLIWPKDYSRLIKDRIDAKPELIKRMSKQKVPLVLYPPALSGKERKRLKEAIEEFKKEN